MARIFSGFIETVVARFDRLADREKRVVVIFGSALLAVVVVGSLLYNHVSLNKKRTQMDEVRQQLSEIQALKGPYLLAKRQHEAEERKFKFNTISLFSHIQMAATRYGLTLYDLNERKEPVEGSSLVETAVVVNLREVSIDRLTAFLQELEESTDNAVVKVTRLKIRAKQDSSGLLDVQMTVSTWKSA